MKARETKEILLALRHIVDAVDCIIDALPNELTNQANLDAARNHNGEAAAAVKAAENTR